MEYGLNFVSLVCCLTFRLTSNIEQQEDEMKKTNEQTKSN